MLLGCSFSITRILLPVSRNPFVSSPFSVELNFGLLVSAFKVLVAFLHPAFCLVFAIWDPDSWLYWVNDARLHLVYEKLSFCVEELLEWEAGHAYGSNRLPWKKLSYSEYTKSIVCLHSLLSLSRSGNSLLKAWLMWIQINNVSSNVLI